MFSYNLQLYFSKQILFGSWEERLFGLHETPVDDTITLLIYKFYIYMTVYLLKYIPYLTLPYLNLISLETCKKTGELKLGTDTQ